MNPSSRAMTLFRVTSPAFENGLQIPDRFTCEGEELSPSLRFEQVPDTAKTLVLVMDDPDAPGGTWDHWLVWNLPAKNMDLSEGADVERMGATQGKNTGGTVGYQGPCPPSGTHRYYVRVHALKEPLTLDRGASRNRLEAAMKDKVLATAELMGTYKR